MSHDGPAEGYLLSNRDIIEIKEIGLTSADMPTSEMLRDG